MHPSPPPLPRSKPVASHLIVGGTASVTASRMTVGWIGDGVTAATGGLTTGLSPSRVVTTGGFSFRDGGTMVLDGVVISGVIAAGAATIGGGGGVRVAHAEQGS